METQEERVKDTRIEEGLSGKWMERIFQVAGVDGLENIVKTFPGKKEQSFFFRDKWEVLGIGPTIDEKEK